MYYEIYAAGPKWASLQLYVDEDEDRVDYTVRTDGTGGSDPDSDWMVLAMFNPDTPTNSTDSASTRHTFEHMAKLPRRPRGANAGNVQVAYYIAPEAKQALVEVSHRLGVSAAEGLEMILTNLALENDGLPIWADRNKIPEALPMARAS